MCGLPGAGDDLANPTHGLGVRGDHGKGTQVVQNVLRGNGLAADAGFGEGHVLGDVRIQVVTDHQHVEMFIRGVDRIGSRRVGGRRQYIGFTAGLDDVRSMSTTGTFGVIGVNGPALHCRQGVLDETRFI